MRIETKVLEMKGECSIYLCCFHIVYHTINNKEYKKTSFFKEWRILFEQ